jgi:nucleoside-diphosphate-sugar epimerase
MKIIVTGINGSLGRQLVRHYASQNHEIVGIGRWPEPHTEVQDICSYIQTDINAINHQLEGDVLIHAAGLSDDKGAWSGFYENNVLGTRNLIKHAKGISTFIFISSSSVYHPSDSLVDELKAGHEIEKLSNYGRSKWLAEEVIREEAPFKSCYILRPRALYGKGDMKIIPRMLRLLERGKLKVPGEMNIRVSLTSYANLMYALDCCLLKQQKGIHTYNISDAREYVLIDAIKKIVRSGLGYSVAVKHIPIWIVKLLGRLHLKGLSPLLVKALTTNMVLDISKARQELNYQPKTNLNHHLESIGKWIKNNGGPESDFFRNAH